MKNLRNMHLCFCWEPIFWSEKLRWYAKADFLKVLLGLSDFQVVREYYAQYFFSCLQIELFQRAFWTDSIRVKLELPLQFWKSIFDWVLGRSQSETHRNMHLYFCWKPIFNRRNIDDMQRWFSGEYCWGCLTAQRWGELCAKFSLYVMLVGLLRRNFLPLLDFGVCYNVIFVWGSVHRLFPQGTDAGRRICLWCAK